MARDAEAVPYTLKLWQEFVSWACIAGRPRTSLPLSLILEVPRLIICFINAIKFSTRSSWLDSTNLPTLPNSTNLLDSTNLPNDCYLSSHVNTLLQLLYILATLEVVLSPVCTVTFGITILRRETTYTEDILVLGLIAISTVVAAVVLALQNVVLNSSLDMLAILRIRPDLSSADVSGAWSSFMGGSFPLVAFILFLVVGGFHIMTVSARHLIPSSKRIPKQFQPFVTAKQNRTNAIEEPEPTTLGTESVAGLDSGTLARLYDDYEKQGLISTDIDLESVNGKASIIAKIRKANRRHRAFQEVNSLVNNLINDIG